MNLLHLHPMLVHFPIALALVALLFNLAAYRFKTVWLDKASVALIILAALGAVAAILSGFLFTKPVAGLAGTLKDTHVIYAVISTVLLLLSSIVGMMCALKESDRIRLKYIFTLLLVLAAVGISLTGMKGGSIVYDVWLF